MAVELDRPRRIVLNIAGVSSQRIRIRRSAGVVALSIAIRGLLVGAGIGTLLISSGQPGLASITVLGVLALGAAMFSWDR